MMGSATKEGPVDRKLNDKVMSAALLSADARTWTSLASSA